MEETYLDMKQRYNELLWKITVQGGMMSKVDRLETLMFALTVKYYILRESYFAQHPARVGLRVGAHVRHRDNREEEGCSH